MQKVERYPVRELQYFKTIFFLNFPVVPSRLSLFVFFQASLKGEFFYTSKEKRQVVRCFFRLSHILSARFLPSSSKALTTKNTKPIHNPTYCTPTRARTNIFVRHSNVGRSTAVWNKGFITNYTAHVTVTINSRTLLPRTYHSSRALCPSHPIQLCHIIPINFFLKYVFEQHTSPQKFHPRPSLCLPSFEACCSTALSLSTGVRETFAKRTRQGARRTWRRGTLQQLNEDNQRNGMLLIQQLNVI